MWRPGGALWGGGAGDGGVRAGPNGGEAAGGGRGGGGIGGKEGRIGIGEGLEIARAGVDDVADHFFGGDGFLDAVHLVEGTQAGVKEAVDGVELALIDVVAGEGVGGRVEVVEDGGMVLGVIEEDERDLMVGPLGSAGFAAHALPALVVHVAELAVVNGGHGAAGAVAPDVAAAAVVGGADSWRAHAESFRLRGAGR